MTSNLAKTSTNANGNITIGHYILGKALGKGTFGHVKQGTHVLTGEKVAVKILEKEKINDQKDVERITREIKILKKVRHNNVIQLYEIIETDKELFMIMEHANGGELFDYIVRHTRLKEQKAAKLYAELIAGIEYLHKSGVCHRDLKPENLLLDYDNTLKIVDFGLSNLYEKGQTLKTACGSPCYAAPEMIAGKRYHGLQTDIWSSGVVFYAMVAGYLPFEDPKTSNLYKKIMSADYQMPKFLSSECKDFITKILNTDPEKRYRIQDIRAHQFMQQNCPQMDEISKDPGLFPGLQKMPWNNDLLHKLIEDYHFEEEYAIRCMEANRHNHITATYHLINKKNHRAKYMRDTFSTHPQKENARDRMKSQGKPGGVELGQVKGPARKAFQNMEVEDMNQTVRVPERKKIENEQEQRRNGDEQAKRATTLDARPQVQTLPKDDEKSDLDRQSIQSPVSPNWEQQRAKVDFMKLRQNKNSVSPEQYKINNTLVVNLQESIKKPNDIARMNQTSYNKGGGKANFFPSTATATTNGSSGNGSSDPRRTTESSRQPSQQNQNNAQVDLNMQLRFGKNQIRLQQAQQRNGEGICQTTKNAWQAVDLSGGGQTTARDKQPHTTTHHNQQILFQTSRANQQYMNTKLQQQVLMIPDSYRASQQTKGRNSPRGGYDGSHSPEQRTRTNNFYTAIQGRGINMNGMQEQKKLILTKLFKGQKTGPPPGTAGNYAAVNSSFNEQLMNQTNFGYNPARNTIVTKNANDLILDQITSNGNRGSLNTQKRNRTHTIDQGYPHNQFQRGSNTQQIAELNSTYASVQKPGSKGHQGTIGSSRQAHHQPMSIFSQQSTQNHEQQQLFLPGAMKINYGQRKSPGTQHMQHRANSHGAQQQQS